MFNDPIMGFVIPFPGNFAPAHWMFCRGQQLPISEHEALFSLLGTAFGGDGITTFALPNLCGRVAVHAGQGAQMQQYIPGETGGHETVSINVNNLPVHNHQLSGITGKPPCANSDGTTSIPTGHYPAKINGGAAEYSTSISDTISMGAATISASTPPAPVVKDNVTEPVHIMSPFLAMNYIICIEGIYPPHS